MWTWYVNFKLKLLSIIIIINCQLSVFARFCTGKLIECNDEDFEVLEVKYTDDEAEETEETDVKSGETEPVVAVRLQVLERSATTYKHIYMYLIW